MDVVHRGCAERWFTIRRATSCEVCGQEASNLPEPIKQSAAAAAAAAQRRSGNSRTAAAAPAGTMSSSSALGPSSPPNIWIRLLGREGTAGSSGAQGWSWPQPAPVGNLGTYLGAYALFCLLPATASSVLLAMYYHTAIHVSVGITMALSILLSTTTMLHWVFVPRQPLVHLGFVTCLLGSVVLLEMLMTDYAIAASFDGTPINMVAIVAACLAPPVALAIFYLIILPISLLILHIMRHIIRVLEVCLSDDATVDSDANQSHPAQQRERQHSGPATSRGSSSTAMPGSAARGTASSSAAHATPATSGPGPTVADSRSRSDRSSGPAITSIRVHDRNTATWTTVAAPGPIHDPPVAAMMV